MRKQLAILGTTGMLLSALHGTVSLAADNQLNVYNWADYIAKDTVPGFEKSTGIHVRYDNFDTDNTLQAKLMAGSSGYDIVVPTSNYMALQIEAGIYQKLDKSKLPNTAYLDKTLMAKIAEADPGNEHGVPWAWGSIGIGYNVEAIRKTLGAAAPTNSWALLLDPANAAKLQECGISLLDSPQSAFSATLQFMGRDPNSPNPADYQAALQTLKKIRPFIRQFSSDGYINDLANNDTCLVLGYSGDVYIANKRAQEAKRSWHIQYSNVKEGGLLWFDVMAVPKDAPHPQAAMKWINYVSDPKVSAAITNEIFYPTANSAARQFVVPSIANDPNIYPSDATLAKMSLMKPVSPEILRLENRLWIAFKSNQ